MARDAHWNDIEAIRDIFVSTGMSRSGAAKAVLTFIDKAPAIALYERARTWYYIQELSGSGSRKYYHSVKWWVCNYRDSEHRPAPGYGVAGAPPAPPGPSQY